MYCAVILSVLMLDEAHERTLYTDIAIGLLKKVIPADSEKIRLEYLTFIHSSNYTNNPSKLFSVLTLTLLLGSHCFVHS